MNNFVDTRFKADLGKPFWVKLLKIVLVIVSLLSLLVYFSEGQHFIELLSHFRPYYLLAQLVFVAVLFCLKEIRWGLLGIVLLGLNLAPILPYYFPDSTLYPKSQQALELKVMQANVYAKNPSLDRLFQFIQAESPDVIALEEVRPVMEAPLIKGLRHDYPYYFIEPEATAFGIALFSRKPFRSAQVIYLGDPYSSDKRMFPSILAEFENKSEQVSLRSVSGETSMLDYTVIATHPLPPLAGFAVRNSQLRDLAQISAQNQGNVIVVGDLNVTPWSFYFQDFLRQSGLKDSQMGFGVQPSWQSPIPGVEIPIDHILVSPSIEVLERRIGPEIGSDHYPVVAKLKLYPNTQTKP